MNTYKLLLSDNTELDISAAGAAEGILWIWLPEMSILEAALIFSDHNKTRTITAYGDVVHEGYTELIHLSTEYEGGIKVALRKEQANDE